MSYLIFLRSILHKPSTLLSRPFVVYVYQKDAAGIG